MLYYMLKNSKVVYLGQPGLSLTSAEDIMAHDAQAGNRAGDCYNTAGHRHSSSGLFIYRQGAGGIGIL
jgi:hypothetical protein